MARRAIAAALLGCAGLPAGAWAQLPERVPQPPMVLPGEARASLSTAEPGTWVVGALSDPRVDDLASRFGATRLTPRGAFVITRSRARSFASALRRRELLFYAEPNRTHSSATARDPLSDAAGWRDVIVDPALQEPTVTGDSPRLVLIDSQVDLSHPEFEGSNVSATKRDPPANEHGTATTAVAAAPVNGRGIVGVWPGMRAVNVPAEDLSCANIARKVAQAIALKPATINMSYGGRSLCFAEFVELQLATGQGSVLVAAAGNEFAQGNPVQYPAALPHVVTVAAVGPDLKPSYFSNQSAAIDLSAPGEGILTAVPPRFDPDGYMPVDGTSFSAPMVAAAVTWLRAARPNLSADQLRQVIRLSARNLGRRGWDAATGYGLLNMTRALARTAPPSDPAEPNDDIVWIDGRAFSKADPAIYTGATKSKFVRAYLDQFEDPSDVARIVFPARSTLRIDVKPRFGDVDLAVYDRRAKQTSGRDHLIERSTKRGTTRDAVTLTNTSRKRVSAYVEAYIKDGAPGLDAGYRLTITKVR